MNAKLFINYRREDTAPYAGRLYDRLTAHFSADQVFIDIDQIEPGEDYVEVINRKVGTCDIAIVAIGPNWLGATDASGKRRLDDEEEFVRMEIVAALQRKIRVIPVLVGGARMPGTHDLPEALAPLSRRHAIELSETRFHTDVNRLIEAIEKSFAVAEKRVELSATRDLGKVRELHQKAADQGHASAQFNLGMLYQRREGVPEHSEKAAELFQKAAEQGHASAQDNLGWLYLIGEGVSKDSEKAAELFQKAADKENANAQCRLGFLYQIGEGVPKNLGKARALYQAAADQGYEPAIMQLKAQSGS